MDEFFHQEIDMNNSTNMAFLLRKLKKFLMIPYIYQSLIKDSVI